MAGFPPVISFANAPYQARVYGGYQALGPLGEFGSYLDPGPIGGFRSYQVPNPIQTEETA